MLTSFCQTLFQVLSTSETMYHSAVHCGSFIDMVLCPNQKDTENTKTQQINMPSPEEIRGVLLKKCQHGQTLKSYFKERPRKPKNGPKKEFSWEGTRSHSRHFSEPFLPKLYHFVTFSQNIPNWPSSGAGAAVIMKIKKNPQNFNVLAFFSRFSVRAAFHAPGMYHKFSE